MGQQRCSSGNPLKVNPNQTGNLPHGNSGDKCFVPMAISGSWESWYMGSSQNVGPNLVPKKLGAAFVFITRRGP